jgi:putative ABC transport system permease protein
MSAAESGRQCRRILRGKYLRRRAGNTRRSSRWARSVEIATLRAIGFRASAVVTSVFAESILLATIGAAAGTAIALFAFDGKAVNSISSQYQPAQLVYQLSISNESIAFAVALAMLIGMLGGLLPAIRAATVPIASALRDG